MTELQKRLFELQDLKYRDFTSKLIPTVNKDTIIGIRSPVLKKFAKEFAKTEEAKEFIKILPHKYFEENNLHAAIIETIKDYGTAMKETGRFLSYIDNWATCDTFLPKVYKKHPEEVFEKVKEFLKSDKTYTIRFGVGILMSNYLNEFFTADMPELVAEIKSDEYYVNMMIAWYFATALAKQYDAAIPYIEEKRLSPWVHNKTIQKAVESFRISDETKAYLKSLKLKSK